MSVERVVQVGLPRTLRRPLSSGLDKKLREVVELVWSELGLSSKPQVDVTDSAQGSVAVNGRPMLVSARRIEQAVLTGSGAGRLPGEIGAPRELLMARLNGPDLDSAANIIVCLVDATLRANVAGLVRAENTEIVQRLTGATGDSAPAPEVISEAVSYAAEHGVVPRELDQLGELIGDARALESDALCERLIHSRLELSLPRPVIEANSPTLRRLTTNGRVLRRENSPLDYMEVLFSDYGVRPPFASLRATDQPESVVRFRFGSSSTPAHLVLPDTQAVLMVHPDKLPPDSGARPFIDPAYGEVWSLIDLPADATWPPDAQLDPVALLTRSLLGEMKMRLPLWSPTFAELPAFESPWFDDERLHLDEANGALRWLLSAQASVHLLPRIMEGVVTAAAEGVRGPTAIAARLRSFLGRAVLGPLAASSNYTLIEVNGPVASAAAESGSPVPLLEQHPTLITATEQLVVSCPRRWRRDVEYLLRPLSDTVVVAADEELALLPAIAT